jgi:ligand-binding sensor domain-containing protein/two-component sensor histidine kinase
MKSLLLWLFLLLFFVPAQAQWRQRPLLCHYTVREGLPSNVVYDVIQDKKGYVWFATDQGVSRFDGTAFRNFSSQDGLPDNEVFKLLEDGYGRIWLVSYNNAACYIEGEKVFNRDNSGLCHRLEAEEMFYSDMARSPDGKFLMIGYHIIELGENSFEYRLQNTNGWTSGRLLYAVYKGREYVGTDVQITLLPSASMYSLIGSNHWKALQDKNKMYVLWRKFGYLFQTWQLNDTGAVRLFDTILPARIHNMYKVKNNDVLCCTENGLMLFNETTNRFRPDTTLPKGIIPNAVFTDRDSNQWYSTINDGVYMKLHSAPGIINKASGLGGSNIMTVTYTSDGNFVTGDDKGVMNLVTKTGIQTMFIQKEGEPSRLLKAYQLNKDSILSASDLGFYMTDTRTGKPTILNYGSAKSLVLRKDYCLFGSVQGVGRYHYGADSAVFLWTSRATAVEETPDRTIWIGTLNGLQCFRDDMGEMVYRKDSLLSRSRITCLAVTPTGFIAVGTNTQGVFIIPGPNSPPLRIHQKMGLSSNTCKKILAGPKDRIWVCTTVGVDVLVPSLKGYSVMRFPLPAGVDGSRINDIAIGNGHLALATVDGLLLVSLDSRDYSEPLLHIQSVNGRMPGEKDTGGLLVLPYNKNDLKVGYTGISFTGGADVLYKYILEGSQADTVFTSDRAINFSALRPGDYKLMIWARNKLGPWTRQPATLRFKVETPFWLNPWIWTAGALLLGAAGYTLYRRRIKAVRLQAQLKEQNKRQMAELEMKALRAQINPHFIFNALNSIQTYYSQNDELTANHYMTSFAQFIRKTLSQSQSHWLSLAEEAKMLHTYMELEQMRFKQVFTPEVIIDPQLDTANTEIPAMLIQPYVENAINHGLRNLKTRKGILSIRFTKVEKGVLCVVEDNGIGREAAQRFRSVSHSSLGMYITRQRVESINQLYHTQIVITIKDKWNAPGDPGGTTIEILIPQLKNQKYADHDTH